MSQKQQTQPSGKTLVGKVVSTKMQKTVVVAVAHSFRHPLYRKAMIRTKRYACHNESLSLAEGDTVRITEVKPISRKKRFWVVAKIG